MDSMCSVKGVLVCVCIFLLYQIKSALVLSSVSMLKPPSFPQKSSVWCRTYSRGNQSHVTAAGAAALGLSREESAIPALPLMPSPLAPLSLLLVVLRKTPESSVQLSSA